MNQLDPKIRTYLEEIKRKPERVFDLERKIRESVATWLIGLDTPIQVLARTVFTSIPYIDKISGINRLGQPQVLFSSGTGMGKTAMAQSLALSLDAKSTRIQGEPTLMPYDITGSERLVETLEGKRLVVFEPGPIFAHVVLFDEASRAHPKGKAAIMEGGEELSVTCKKDFICEDGITERTLPLFPLSGRYDDFDSPRFFMVLFTQNPIEEEDAAYPDPKGQVDRITLRIPLNYPGRNVEKQIKACNVVGKKITPVSDLYEILACAQYIYDNIRESENASAYRSDLINNTRPEEVQGSPGFVEYVKKHVLKGVSPRAHFHLEGMARTWAFFSGDSLIKPEHVKAVAPLVLTHRVFLTPAVLYSKTPEAVFEEILQNTPMPRWE